MEIQRCHKEAKKIIIKLGEDFVCYHLRFDQLIPREEIKLDKVHNHPSSMRVIDLYFSIYI